MERRTVSRRLPTGLVAIVSVAVMAVSMVMSSHASAAAYVDCDVVQTISGPGSGTNGQHDDGQASSCQASYSNFPSRSQSYINSDGDLTFTLTGESTSTAVSSPGTLHASSVEQATDSPQEYIFSDGVYTNPRGLWGSAKTQAYSDFYDQLTVEGPASDPYGLVDLRLTLDVYAAVDTSVCLDSGVTRIDGGGPSSPSATLQAQFAVGGKVLSVSYDACNPSASSLAPVSVDLALWGGTTVDIFGSLLTQTSISWAYQQVIEDGKVQDDMFIGQVSAQSDASDTGHYYVDVETPGASYITESGVNYSSPPPTEVPEPASFAVLATELVAMGLATVLFRRRGQRVT
jgi:hypothetical protein